MGHLSQEKIVTALKEVTQVICKHHPFTLNLQGANTFVTERAPTVLWYRYDMNRLVSLMLTVCFSCGPNPDVNVALQVVRSSLQVRANDTDLVNVEVTYPVDDQGRFLKTKLPGLVFVPGGLLGPADYRWLADALAPRGFVVAIPEQSLRLAFFSIGNGEAARKLLTSSPYDAFVNADNIAIGGHSLGGVVAVKLALKGGFSQLMVQASYADTADYKALESYSKPTLLLAGENDCMASIDRIKAESAKFPTPLALVTVKGVTHYQFTNSDAPDFQKKCDPGISLDDAHATVLSVVTQFLQGRPISPADGIEVEQR
jgi:hypothetical protein